jgi:PD-(D/E)XK nuclease superfamily
MGATNLEVQALKRLGEWPGFADLRRLAKRPTESNFFRDCRRIVRSEGVHSDVLAWLLNPAGSHGFGDRFACELVESLVRQCHPRPTWCGDRPNQTEERLVTQIEVVTEYPTLKGSIDVLVKARYGGNSLVLGIENKVDARLGIQQLRRYEEGLRSQFGEKGVLLVYLTLDGDDPGPDDVPVHLSWCAIGYRVIVNILEKVLTVAKQWENPSLEAQHGWWLAAQYLSLVRHDLMNENEAEKERLCRELYEQHREAWRVIRSYLPSAKDEFHERIGRQSCELLREQYAGEWHYIVRRDGHADIYSQAWLKRFGPYRKDDLSPRVWLKADGQPNTLAAVHLRVSTEVDDDAQAIQVRVGLKVRGTKFIESKTHRRLKDALPKSTKEWSGSGEKTITLKSAKLGISSGVGTELTATKVAEWVMHHALQPKKIVETLDKIVASSPSK